MHIRTQTHSSLTNAQSWKRKQCVLFCLLSAEGLVSHTNVLCFRLKVSGQSVQHQWPLSQAAFNRLYCWFWVSLWEGQRLDNRESWFSRAPWQIGAHTPAVQLCLDVLFVSDSKSVRRIHVILWEQSSTCCVTLTAQNQHEIPQSFSADLSLA